MRLALFFVLLASPAFGQVGPQASITCPAGAVAVFPGASIQAAVNAAPSAATFCIKAGIHYLTGSITPKTGNTFIGESVAILDGSKWVTADNTQAAFRAHNQDIDDVTIRNLRILHMPQKAIHAFKDFSDRWTIEHNEIAFAKHGVSGGTVVRFNAIHHNIDDPANPDPARRGGGYAFYLWDHVLLEGNEIAYNGPEQKFMSTVGAVVRNNFVHHNYEGIWFDGNGDFLIEGNRVEDNTGNGIFHELSQRAVIRNNIISRNGGNAIFVSTSRASELSGNILEDNFRGITFFVYCGAVGFNYYGREDAALGPADLTNNIASGNTTSITAKAPAGSIAALFSYTTCTTTQHAPYLSNTKANRYQGNRYSVSGDGWWFWVTAKSWAQWQGLGHDVAPTSGPVPPSNVRVR
jgi:parallel beta-helix repeat protein